MKKWFDEEYEFTVEVTGFLRGDQNCCLPGWLRYVPVDCKTSRE